MIRKVTEEDLDECVYVIRDSFLTVAKEFGFTVENAPGFTAFSTTKEKITQQFQEHRPMFIYVAEDGKMAGYYSLCMQDNNECELNNLCVLSDYRHKEIGEKLLNHAFEYARQQGCIKMNIGIVEENKKLRKWYENHGLIHTGTKKFDFFPFTCGFMEIEL